MNNTDIINLSNSSNLLNSSNSSSQEYFTNFTNFINYDQYNGYSYGNHNSNPSMLYNQVLTMTIIPLITTIFSTFFTSLLNDTKKLIGYIVNYYNLKSDNKKMIQYKLYIDNDINIDIIPIIWYINKTNSIKEGNMISFDEIMGDKKKIDMLLCPIYKNSTTIDDTNNANILNDYYYNNNNQHNNNNNQNNNQTNIKSGDYLFVEINDEKKLFYYGVNSNNFCLMSYKSSIQELGEYILDIKNKYIEYKSSINKNIIKEKKIYIELYLNAENKHYDTPDVKKINKKVIPLIWYLNNKRLVTQGILTKLSDTPNINESSANNESNTKISDFIIMPFIDDNKSNEIPSNNNDDDSVMKISPKNKSITNTNKTDNVKKLIEIDKYIFGDFVFKKHKQDCYPYALKAHEFIVIQSEKYSIDELANWLENINQQYYKHIENIIKIQYLYTYTSCSPDNKFVKSLLDKTQTFEHLFFEKKNEILTDIKNFSNLEYYQKFGMKRKLGYLLVGPPGSGKSALVTAIANSLGRSLKNIPISLIKTNSEFEKAYGNFSYDNQEINSDEIVITFDEIDSAYDSQKLIKITDQNKPDNLINSEAQSNTSSPVIVINTDNKNSKEFDNMKNINPFNKDDKLNIGIVLSKLDGNENQEGSVIIATCNDLSKLDPAIYRNGRLKLIELKYAGCEEIKQMIEKYCEIVLNNKQKNKIRNDLKIQTLNIKHSIAKYLLDKNFSIMDENIDEIIEIINNL